MRPHRRNAIELRRLDIGETMRSLTRKVRRALRRNATNDDDALHDFRVAVRRLCAWLRAFGPDLPGVSGKRHCRRFGKLIDQTNAARDAQVHADWLARKLRQPHAPRGVRTAARQLLLDRVRPALAERHCDPSRVRQRTLRCLRALDSQLQSLSADKLPDSSKLYCRALLRSARRLERLLESVQRRDDPAAAHAARLCGKRLRYLLEPLARRRASRSLLADICELQDRLGELHDLHTLEQRLVAWRQERLPDPDSTDPLDAPFSHDAALLREIRREQQHRYSRLRGSGLTHGWPQRIHDWIAFHHANV
jgi:CHAD domain-containing protein